MKARFSIIIAGLISLFAVSAEAQTDADALRYSQSSITGTARYTSMAGAFGALGGDFSATAINPAGLGIYRSSEFTFSPSLYLNQTSSNFLGNESTESRYNFNIPNLAFVFNHQARNASAGWKSWSIGIGLNRINSFQANTYYQGYNQYNSLLDYFVENANNTSLNPDELNDFFEKLAYKTGLIYLDNDSAPNYYLSDLKEGQGITQYRTGTTRGAMNEWNFNFGTNYNDVLYLGFGFGIRSIRYEDESTFEEKDKDNSIDVLNSFSFEQDVTTRGTGINGKLGVIVRPVDWLRVGASVHTPTVYSMRDDYVNTMTSNLDYPGYTGGTESSPFGHFDYTLSTPLEATASLGFVIAKSALIGIDYQMLNYSTARFKNSSYFTDVNDVVREKYRTTGNLRIGGEYRWQNLSFRSGYAYYGSPFSDAEKVSGADYSKSSYSGGIGLRDHNYFVDLGYIFTTGNEYFQPYSLSYMEVPGVQKQINTHNVVLTFGVKF